MTSNGAKPVSAAVVVVVAAVLATSLLAARILSSTYAAVGGTVAEGAGCGCCAIVLSVAAVVGGFASISISPSRVSTPSMISHCSTYRAPARPHEHNFACHIMSSNHATTAE
jgi:hypothetical protein